ncbi:MAG: DUF456 domain-containing protein [Firmicutes bacterium]|nr:DUF456 domain-containing protein [Bacillota bacterium]
MLLAITIIILGIGVIMSIFPFLPGIPLIFGTFLVYGFFEGFERINSIFLIAMLIITVLSFFIDNLAGWVGAKRYGASRAGVWGALLGGLLGVLINPLLGILLGPLTGAVIAEIIISQRPLRESLRVGIGTLVGFLGGSILRFIIALFMVITFLYVIF